MLRCGKLIPLAAVLLSAANAHGAKPPPKAVSAKKALALIKAGYASASGSTINALQNNVMTTGGATLQLSGSTGGSNASAATVNSTAGLTTVGTGTLNLISGNPAVGARGVISGLLTLLTQSNTGSGSSSSGVITIGGSTNSGTTTTVGGGTANLNLNTSGSTGGLGVVATTTGSTLTLNTVGSGVLTAGATLNSFAGTLTLNSGTLRLGVGNLTITSAVIGQSGPATITNGSVSSYLLKFSDGTTQLLAPGASLTVSGSPYVIGIAPAP
jgi:hypothetical protein